MSGIVTLLPWKLGTCHLHKPRWSIGQQQTSARIRMSWFWGSVIALVKFLPICARNSWVLTLMIKWFIRSFIHLFLYSSFSLFICSYIHYFLFVYLLLLLFVFFLFIRSFIRSFRCSMFIYVFVHSFICLFILLFVRSFLHCFVHSFIHFFIYSFVHSFVPLFLNSSIHSFIDSFIDCALEVCGCCWQTNRQAELVQALTPSTWCCFLTLETSSELKLRWETGVSLLLPLISLCGVWSCN